MRLDCNRYTVVTYLPKLVNTKIGRYVMTKQILICNYKGGVGKTSTAINIADWLENQNHSVMLIDCDPNRSATKLKARGERLGFKILSQQRALSELQKKSYEYLVIDSQARPHSEELSDFADGADLVVLPMAPSIDDLDPTLEAIADLKKLDIDHYRILLSAVPPKPSREGKTMRDELLSGGYRVFDSWIRRSAGIPKAALEGCAVRNLTGNYKLPGRDYARLGTEIIQFLEENQ